MALDREDLEPDDAGLGVQDALADLDDVGTVTVASGQGGFASSDIEVDVTAPSSDALQTATDAVVAGLDGKAGIGQVTSNLSASLPYVAVSVDRTKAASAEMLAANPLYPGLEL